MDSVESDPSKLKELAKSRNEKFLTFLSALAALALGTISHFQCILSQFSPASKG